MAELPAAILNKLTQIESLLNSSHVLNGGFEKLVQDVQHTNDQLGEVKESLEAMNSTINDPESGVRSRVRDLEAESQRRWEFVQEAKIKIDDFEELQVWKKEVEDKAKPKKKKSTKKTVKTDESYNSYSCCHPFLWRMRSEERFRV